MQGTVKPDSWPKPNPPPGKLFRVPFVKHPPEDIPTMDSYYMHGEHGGAGGDSRQLCFPRIYANGCVPRVNQEAVDASSCP